MNIYLKEKIGNPDLFTGRKAELTALLRWIERIKREVSPSTAILSRRKTGKTALLQRLYNITFDQNNGVIPFYYEIRETDQWIADFSVEFFLTFLYQYIAFKTRKPEYITYSKDNLDRAMKTVKKEKLDDLRDMVEDIEYSRRNGHLDNLWNLAREAPRIVAQHHDERVVQFVDEFQYLNKYFFRDQECRHPINNLAGSYLHTCEYKNAPLLVSGSWVGWLMNDLITMLPGRFHKFIMKNIPETEAIEMIFKYALIDDIPVTQEGAFLLARFTEGNPFYISALFRSRIPNNDLTSRKGIQATLEFETLHQEGQIRDAWLEYITSAFQRVNGQAAIHIVLYLSKHRNRFVSRKELKQQLNLDMSDAELERKLEALAYSDIIEENKSLYRGVQDNLFDKIFRSKYSDDIENFVIQEAPAEYQTLLETMQARYSRLEGRYNRYKGAFAEFMICNHLRNNAHQDNVRFQAMLTNSPDDFEFVRYERVWSFASPPLEKPEFQVDIWARPKEPGYAIIGEVKNRKAKFSVKEAAVFLAKAQKLQALEKIDKAVRCVFSLGGFYQNTISFFHAHDMAYSDDSRWLER